VISLAPNWRENRMLPLSSLLQSPSSPRCGFVYDHTTLPSRTMCIVWSVMLRRCHSPQ
jgi:hypothetical protein